MSHMRKWVLGSGYEIGWMHTRPHRWISFVPLSNQHWRQPLTHARGSDQSRTSSRFKFQRIYSEFSACASVLANQDRPKNGCLQSWIERYERNSAVGTRLNPISFQSPRFSWPEGASNEELWDNPLFSSEILMFRFHSACVDKSQDDWKDQSDWRKAARANKQRALQFLFSQSF